MRKALRWNSRNYLHPQLPSSTSSRCPCLPDSLCGFFPLFWGGSELHTFKSRGWWNNSLTQWSDNKKKQRLHWRMIKAPYHLFFFKSFFSHPDGGGSCQATSSFTGRSQSPILKIDDPTTLFLLFPLQQQTILHPQCICHASVESAGANSIGMNGWLLVQSGRLACVCVCAEGSGLWQVGNIVTRPLDMSLELRSSTRYSQPSW